MTTTGEFAAERAQLGQRDRDELHEIASAMGVRGATRLRKADLIEAILDKATSGTSVPEPTGEKPKKRATRRKAADSESAAAGGDDTAQAGGGEERAGGGRGPSDTGSESVAGSGGGGVAGVTFARPALHRPGRRRRRGGVGS